MNSTEKNILDRIFKIKEKLIDLKLKYLKVDPLEEYNTVILNNIDSSEITKLLNYPSEYKMFLEQIGTVYIAFADAFMLEVSIPIKISDSSFWGLDDNIRCNDDFRIIAHTDNDDIFYLIYDTTEIPIKRYCEDEECSKMNLLDLVEQKINCLIHDAENLNSI
jgi:hypothetical protein